MYLVLCTDWNSNVTNTCRWFLSTPSCQTPASPTWWWSPAASWRSPTTPASSWRRTAPWSRRWTAATTRPRQPVPPTNRSLSIPETLMGPGAERTNDLFVASDPADKDFLAVFFYSARAKHAFCFCVNISLFIISIFSSPWLMAHVVFIASEENWV